MLWFQVGVLRHLGCGTQDLGFQVILKLNSDGLGIELIVHAQRVWAQGFRVLGVGLRVRGDSRDLWSLWAQPLASSYSWS